MNTADIGFENRIWKAADKVRGNIDASEYKSVVLGLIFMKYISDRFEQKYCQLVEEEEGFEEDKDEYTAENIFYVPAEARWSVIAAQAHTPEIGAVIDNAMRVIEHENKRLKDILPNNFARSELDKRRWGEVVDLFTNIQMHEHGEEKDILGRIYEYCLAKFAEAEGKLAGEFYMPVSSKPLYRCCNLSADVFTTPVAVRVGCLCSRRSLCGIWQVISTIFPYTGRIPIPRLGKWHR